MRIHTDDNGVAVNAISTTSDGRDVEGHLYQVLAGTKTVHLEFQQGAVKEQGVNGLTNEALLAPELDEAVDSEIAERLKEMK